MEIHCVAKGLMALEPGEGGYCAPWLLEQRDEQWAECVAPPEPRDTLLPAPQGSATILIYRDARGAYGARVPVSQRHRLSPASSARRYLQDPPPVILVTLEFVP